MNLPRNAAYRQQFDVPLLRTLVWSIFSGQLCLCWVVKAAQQNGTRRVTIALIADGFALCSWWVFFIAAQQQPAEPLNDFAVLF